MDQLLPGSEALLLQSLQGPLLHLSESVVSLQFSDESAHLYLPDAFVEFQKIVLPYRFPELYCELILFNWGTLRESARQHGLREVVGLHLAGFQTPLPLPLPLPLRAPPPPPLLLQLHPPRLHLPNLIPGLAHRALVPAPPPTLPRPRPHRAHLTAAKMHQSLQPQRPTAPTASAPPAGDVPPGAGLSSCELVEGDGGRAAGGIKSHGNKEYIGGGCRRSIIYFIG